ncbi:DUF5129 domain-containing protein [Arthrobacter sp. 4R501]|uniref:DUF5129 domain-containing protein n=1 Tax=Arthrobacter sp. 4R501 TaxID=2058886 RepID=UPI0021577798|nr:DUF5129 domain-containing protein [Arthrobacter sp. 4R501]
MEQLLSKRHGQGDSATAADLRSFRDASLPEIERWPQNSRTARSHRKLPWTGCATAGAIFQFS